MQTDATQPKPINRKSLTIHNKTMRDISPWHEHIIAAAETGTVCDELSDIFTVRREERADGRTWVTVDFT